jgi:hypothetical protein
VVGVRRAAPRSRTRRPATPHKASHGGARVDRVRGDDDVAHAADSGAEKDRHFASSVEGEGRRGDHHNRKEADLRGVADELGDAVGRNRLGELDMYTFGAESAEDLAQVPSGERAGEAEEQVHTEDHHQAAGADEA